MITIECDNCEIPFDVDPDDFGGPGGKVSCPECGDVNRIPDGADLPDADAAEEEILRLRPAMFRAKPFRFMLILLLVAGGIGGSIWAGTKDHRWAVYGGLGLIVIGIVWWTIWYLIHLGQLLRISNKRTTYRRGLLSRHTSEVLHNHIRNLQIRQSVYQRLVNLGDIVLDSAATGGAGGAEIRVQDVPRPGELKRIVDEYRSF